MKHEIKIPSVGESISSGQLSQWHKKSGEAVRPGDVILTLETDKVSTEVTAQHAGVLEISTPEGQEVEIGAVVGMIDSAATVAATPAAAAPAPPPPVIPQPKVEPKSAAPAIVIPLATPDAARAPVPDPVLDASARVTRRRMSPLRRKIATHLVNAQHTAAILTTFNECDMTEIMALRKQIQESFLAKHGVKLGFMSFFIKAVVDALKFVPQVNGRIEGDDILINNFYDIGIAVGTEKGLVVPVVRDCDQKSFGELEQAILDYAAKAKEGRLQLDDLQGGVFTISNGGVYGSLLSTPILNPPQSAILGMHAIQQRPVAVNGKVEIRPMMYLALSYDHRLIDGKEAVTFLIRIKECLEAPARMLFGL